MVCNLGKVLGSGYPTRAKIGNLGRACVSACGEQFIIELKPLALKAEFTDMLKGMWGESHQEKNC